MDLLFILSSYFVLFLSFYTKLTASIDCSTPIQSSAEECCSSVPQFVSKELIDECGLKGNSECEPFQCILRKKLLLSMDNKLDKSAIQKYAVKGLSGDWVPAIELTLQTCFSDVEGDSCEARKFVGCFLPNVYKNCPVSAWTNSGDCKKAKEYLSNCKPVM